MPAIWLFGVLILLAAFGFHAAKSRALASGGGDQRLLHSRPGYYGANAALAASMPALLVLLVWLIAQPVVINGMIGGDLDTMATASERSLALAEVRRVADGLDLVAAQDTRTEMLAATDDIRTLLGGVGIALGADVTQHTLDLAQRYRSLSDTGDLFRTAVVVLIALACGGLAIMQSNKDFRARNTVERAIMVVLIAAASVAVLTTVGIFLSLITNTIDFLGRYPFVDFLFRTTWEPSFSGRGGQSDLGFLPLLWGTLYISFIALAVAVPIGLFAAIYLSEYASPTVRAIAKPLLELLAGIPTIVYGLFALLTVGPLLLDAFGAGGWLGVGWMTGGTAAMTAGLVMGIMLIPFVSSLSDDIINAVPQSLRDGSFGLGATQSETIRQVVLPAALPGIVGAVLLAASRAIGETMIVVLGAGAAASLSLNPFEAMTTVTAKIVSQLTGDGEFNSPETLVAFALGITLFIITLGLNIVALIIVRKYREQYD